ncbi:MAG: cardiolipin synthase [Clostridia bacterium]|nr:cardiolipin synthase [Clostridia bacterium]
MKNEKRNEKTLKQKKPRRGDASRLKARYIPFRFLFVVFLIVLGTLVLSTAVAALAYFFKLYAVIPILLIYIFSILKIIRSEDNPDYKIPWLILIFIFPIFGIVCYLTFYSRRLPKSQQKLIKAAREKQEFKDDTAELAELKEISPLAHGQVKMLCAQSGVHLYKNTQIKYFPLGEDMFAAMLEDLKKAEKYIFMEYFIIERGTFWNAVLEVLKEKAASGVVVAVVYDDIGSMRTLPGNYFKKLRKLNINAVPFSRFRATSDGEFNNRSHRKITVIDGKVGYTGGINIADEYINVTHPLGHWKDTAVRLEGEAVFELMKMFIVDFAMNVKKRERKYFDFENLGSPEQGSAEESFVVPFGDGPVPVYRDNVAKNIFISILAQAKDYVYITTPYLIIDNELANAISAAAVRGVDVRIIVPHKPDKRIIHFMTRSYYPRLVKNGVKIYEYTPGFIHSKLMISDDTTGVVGTINLDYRSLVHHFEDGVWFYNSPALADIKKDFADTVEKSKLIKPENLKNNFFRKLIEAIIRLFAPML